MPVYPGNHMKWVKAFNAGSTPGIGGVSGISQISYSQLGPNSIPYPTRRDLMKA